MSEMGITAKRVSPLAMSSEEFRSLGHQLVDRIASFFDSIPQRPVTPGESPSVVREALAAHRTLPRDRFGPGASAGERGGAFV